jgi:DNA-binding XRE family transcriptional regulator
VKNADRKGRPLGPYHRRGATPARVCFLSEAEVEADRRDEELDATIASMPGANYAEKVEAYCASRPGLKDLDALDVSVPDPSADSGGEERRRARAAGLERAKEVGPLRRSLGLTQAAAAARMGVARTTVVAIEKGDRTVSEEELERLRSSAS